MKLKYLYSVGFKDGSIYHQNADDTPQVTSGGSAFSDVKARIDDVLWFSLCDPLIGVDHAILTVELTHGVFQFCVNGIFQQFVPSDPSRILPTDAKLKLIFFRRHRHVIQYVQQVAQEMGHTIEYVLGYQTLDTEGKNYQQTVTIL